MNDQDLIMSAEAGVLRLTINRPQVMNALNDSVIHGLTEAIEAAQEDPGTRAIVLTGAGDRAFCAGADLSAEAGTFAFDPSRPTTSYAELLRTAWSCTLPLIARVNGHCLAGGMGLLAVCDLAVAVAVATFGLPEVKVGMFPMQVAALLHTTISRRSFDEMCLTGEPISSAEAERIGLISYVVPADELDAKTSWIVARTVEKSPTAHRRGKYALRAIRDMTTEQALAYMEGQLVSLAQTEDAAEGMMAFNEKRAPVWTGR